MMTHFSKSYHAHVSTCEIAILLLRLHSFVFSYCDMFLLWRWMLLFFRSSWNTGQTGQMPMHCGTCACTWACAWVPRPVPEVSRSQHRSEAVSRQASSSDGYWICFWITICQTQPQSKHLKGRSVPRVSHVFLITKDFVIFLFQDTFRIQRILLLSLFLDTFELPVGSGAKWGVKHLKSVANMAKKCKNPDLYVLTNTERLCFDKYSLVFNWILMWAEVLTFVMTFSTWTVHDRGYRNFLYGDTLTPEEVLVLN